MKAKVKNSGGSRKRTYPSVLELAMKAGKWSVLVGGGALIIGGTTGCEEVSTPGVLELDGSLEDACEREEDQNHTDGMPYVDINDWKEDIQNPDAVDGHQDEGTGFDDAPLMGMPYLDEYEDGDYVQADDGQTPDVVEVDQGVPLPGEAPIDIIADPGDVVTPDVDVDPGLGGDPIVDVFSGDSDAIDVLP